MQVEAEKFWLFRTYRDREVLLFRAAEASALLQKLSCVPVNVDHTEGKRCNDFQGLTLSSRVLCSPRTCNTAYDIALSFCLLLLEALLQILPHKISFPPPTSLPECHSIP